MSTIDREFKMENGKSTTQLQSESVLHKERSETIRKNVCNKNLKKKKKHFFYVVVVWDIVIGSMANWFFPSFARFP